MKSSGCKSRPAKASEQAGSECCHSSGDWWVRSVHSKEAGREGSAPKSYIVAMPTPLAWRKAASGRPITQGRPGIAGVPSPGHASTGISQEPRRAPHPLLITGGTDSPRETGGEPGGMAEQSYKPILPAKVGNRRAPVRGGHGTHWREGANKRTYLPKET